MTGTDILSIRRLLGFKQGEFAELVGLNRSYLSTVENSDEVTEAIEFKIRKAIYDEVIMQNPETQERIRLLLEKDGKNWMLVSDSPENYGHKTARKAKAGRSVATNHTVRIRQLLAEAVDQFQDGTYELFDVEGSSMERTLSQGDKLLCRMIKLEEVVDNHLYVLVINKPDLNEYRKSGVWVKRLQYRKEKGYVNCKSDNKETTEPFPTFRLKVQEIEEVWHPVMRLTSNMSDPNRDIYDKLDELESRIEMLEDLNE